METKVNDDRLDCKDTIDHMNFEKEVEVKQQLQINKSNAHDMSNLCLSFVL